MLQLQELVLVGCFGLFIAFAYHHRPQEVSTPPSLLAAHDPILDPPPSPILDYISTPYNEDIIVELITDLYKTLIDLAYISEDDFDWPPEGGHALREATCKELHLDPAVPSLVKRLPFPKNLEVASFHLFPDSYPYCLTDDRTFRSSRDPTVVPYDDSEPPKLDYLLPHDVAFSWKHRDGMCLVLDTRENTIRMLDYCSRYCMDNPPEFEPERPDDPDHYRNTYKEHAPSFLRRLLKEIRTLKLIPTQNSAGNLVYCFEYDGAEYRELKRALEEDYGWLDDFRREDWHRDIRLVRERAIQAGYDELSD